MIYGNIIAFFTSGVEGKLFLLSICTLSILIKAYFIKIVTLHELRSPKIHLPWIFLLGILIGSSFEDFAWAIKIVHKILAPEIGYSTVTFFIRLAWGFLVIHYHSLSLFVESLSQKQFRLSRHQKISLPLSLIIAGYFFYLAFFATILNTETERKASFISSSYPLEISVMRYTTLYLLCCLALPSLFIAFSRIRSIYLPRILRKQLSLFTSYLLLPYVLIEIMQSISIITPSLVVFPIVSISNALLIILIYLCIRRIMGLRFLNYSTHVRTTYRASMVHDFKMVLEKLSQANNVPELIQVSQHFFRSTFGIPLRKVGLYIRSTKQYTAEDCADDPATSCCNIQKTVEHFLRMENSEMNAYLNKHRILIHDEIEFSNFYEENKTRQTLISFLDALNAELFIPIFNKKTVIAYVVVENHARHHEFYGTVERDEMILFANYINHIITLLQNKNIHTLMQQEKELQEELYSKIQQVNRHKETVQSFIRHNKEKKIGIVFYKNRRFSFGNKEAKELIQVNINQNEGHFLTKQFKKIVQLVGQYKMPHRSLVKDIKNNTLVLSGVPHLDKNSVIIAVYYPEVTDLLTNQIDLLKDSTKWDYLLYLESTKPGKLVNQLIPGSGEQLLNFKISLLKTALGNKATLLGVHEQDLMPTVELLHHISMRSHLHVMSLDHAEQHGQYAIKLFGISPLFSLKKTQPALLKKLNNVGTLFIKNIHLLAIDTQNYLAEFIRYGYYRIYKSEQVVMCNVRIIASTDQDLLNLVHNNLFSADLYNELKKTILTMPALDTLSEKELTNLADGITEQAVQDDDIKAAMALTSKEKSKITDTRPMSIQELRKKIQEILQKKAITPAIYKETQFSGAYRSSSPELAHAAQLGRQALRNAKIMKMLWNKFKNQNKIAAFLRVNRSSVNRRCKQYNLE